MREIYSDLPKPSGQAVKRKVDEGTGEEKPGPSKVSKTAAKNEKKKIAKAKAKAGAAAPAVPLAAIEDRREKKGKGKGKGNTLPDGIKTRNAEGKNICFGFSKGEKCVQDPCHFAHVCWWCFGDHSGAKCTKPR